MIQTWMLYSVVAGGVVTFAAVLAERGARAMHWPTRGVWVLALAGTLLIPIVPAAGGRGAAPTSVPPLSPVEASDTQGTSAASTEPSAADPAATELAATARAVQVEPFYPAPPEEVLASRVWILGSALFLAFLLRSALQLRARGRRWRASHLIYPEEVWVADSEGPFLAGMVRPRIVVPRWLLDWEPESRRLVIEHERQHLAGHDPWLVAFASLALALMPWNPFLWWSRRRLIAAVEADCDQRVLGGAVDPVRYAHTLLEAARWSVPLRLAPGVLDASSSELERRMKAILGRRHPRRIGIGSAFLFLGCSLAAVPRGVGVPDAPSVIRIAAVARTMPLHIAPQDLPGTPPPGRLEAELIRHHPEAMENGLPNERRVWFIVDRMQNVLYTGIAEGSRQEITARLRAEYPDETSDFQLGFIVDATTDTRLPIGAQPDSAAPTVRVIWMLPP